MKIHSVIDVIVTDKVRSPALFGYFHPRLLLPQGIFESLSDEDLSYVFMHELGHLKRHDIGVCWLVAILQAAYWFNPLVWVAFYQMRIDQESACDESVLSRIKHHQSADYAKAIVGFLEKFYQNCKLPSLAGVMENKTQMKRRITNIVHYKKYSRKLTVAAVVLFISTGFIFYTLTGVAKEKRMQSVMKPVVEKSFADVKSGVDGGDITSAETIPAVQAEVSPKPLYSMHSEISHSKEKAEDVLEFLGEDHGVYPNNEASSLMDTGVADEVKHVAQDQPIKEQRNSSIKAGSFHTAENSTDISRVVKKTAELSSDLPRAVKTRPPAMPEPERKTEADGFREQQPEETSASSLVASIDVSSPGSLSPGASPVKPGEEFTEKRGIDTNRNASVPGTGPDDSVQQAGLTETNVLPGSNQGRAGNHSETVASTANSKMITDAGSEILPESEVSRSMAETDRGEDGGGTGFLVSDVDKPPRVINAVPPRYPYKAKRDEITGYIKLRFIITKDGDAIDTTVVESSPEGVFDKSALEALESYRFKPGIKDGKAVDVQVNLPIKFNFS